MVTHMPYTTVTGHESWFYCYDPETKRQSADTSRALGLESSKCLRADLAGSGPANNHYNVRADRTACSLRSAERVA
ncbi:hypothetical protein EVAR_65322_1 [Eumeta japonica]|uniref:Uncharacterized protein n=1 Tax=Eumeta variegata TaxID=151549 RepID=A0A4C1YV58_EUMVA|nr:hypothetical protein EVAR_65322_1 [Eumeta japonica]